MELEEWMNAARTGASAKSQPLLLLLPCPSPSMSLLRILPRLLKPFHKHVETFSPFRASQQDTHIYGWGSITSTNTNTPMELSLHKQKPGAMGGPPTLHLTRDNSSQRQVKRSSFLCVQCSMVSHVPHSLMVAPQLEKHRDERNYAFPWTEVQQRRRNTTLRWPGVWWLTITVRWKYTWYY